MLPFMGNFRGWEWIIILLLALLLFGGFKKLPDAARGIGRSLRIFKAETKGLADDDAPAKGAEAAPKPVDTKPTDKSSTASEASETNEAKNPSASA